MKSLKTSSVKMVFWTVLAILFGMLVPSLLFRFETKKGQEVVETPQETTQKQETNEEKEIKPDFVNLAFVGDMMFDRGVKNSVQKNFNGDFSVLFEKIGILKEADITFGNLEGPVSERGKNMGSKYSFRMDPKIIPVLKEVGFSIVSVANNHAGDWGQDAYEDTLKSLRENGIKYVGGGVNLLDAGNPAIFDINGMKIGYLGFSDIGPNWMQATEKTGGVLIASNPNFDEVIKNAVQQTDFLIVSFHFGEEYKTIHNNRQEYLAHKTIDDGAKIVIGHHPHVVEDTEAYSPKDCTQSSCMGFIAYSLGNFIFDQAFSSETMQGMLLQIKLYKDGNMSIQKNTSVLNTFFQREKIINGAEEKMN